MSVQTDIQEWFAARVPADWFTGLEVAADPDEILVTGVLADGGAGEAAERLAGFREQTRQGRMEIANEAERLFNRKVSWGASSGDVRTLFTHLSIPVMTRLRLPERAVLDTLVSSGVARSRSHALSWCARLVAEHQSEWLGKLREANAAVEKVRREGPAS